MTESVTPEQQAQQEQENQAAFSKGFSKVRATEEPVVKEAPQEEPKAAEVEPPKEPDPWEGVPAKVREKYEALEAKLAENDKVVARVRNVEGHIGNLTSQLKIAQAAAKAAEAKGKEAPTPEQLKAAQDSEARRKQLKEDFPDFAEELESLRSKVDALPKVEVPDMKEVEARVLAAAEKRIAQSTVEAQQEARRLAPIDLKHPGWEQLIVSTAFQAWEATQKPEVKKLASSANPLDAISMLDLYAADQKKAAEKAERQKRLDAVIAPKGQPAVPDTTESDQDAFHRGFKKVRGG